MVLYSIENYIWKFKNYLEGNNDKFISMIYLDLWYLVFQVAPERWILMVSTHIQSEESWLEVVGGQRWNPKIAVEVSALYDLERSLADTPLAVTISQQHYSVISNSTPSPQLQSPVASQSISFILDICCHSTLNTVLVPDIILLWILRWILIHYFYFAINHVLDFIPFASSKRPE